MTGLRFGLDSESAKLSLGALMSWDRRQPGSAHQALMSLPGMTSSIADAILDWIDADSMPRSFGAEADYYRDLGVPYGPRNGVPQCLEELLLVRGVTRQLLYGADADFNHLVTAGERRAAADQAEPRARDAGGWAGGPPWASLLTVYAAERNETLDGRPRINVNQDNLRAVHQQLAQALDSRAAAQPRT